MTTFDLTASDPAIGPIGNAGRWRIAAAWLAGWTALVIAMAGIVSTQKNVPFIYSLRSEAINYYTLAVLSVAVWFAADAIGGARWPLALKVLAHAVLGVLLTAVWQGVNVAYLWSALGPYAWTKVYRGTWMFQAMNACVFYSGVLGGTLAVQAMRRARENERQQHQLALTAREAELRALSAQLEPHFLLNTLNSILALVDSRPADARLMIERLSELLRAAFDEFDEAQVPLRRELQLLDAYLGIEQVRFGDRLRVRFDIQEAFKERLVPPFLLQPIVENAIKHAIAPNLGPAFIRVGAHRTGDFLRIEVIDSGRGFDYQTARHRGRGLRLAERRLKAYAPSGEINAQQTANGFAVFMTLPV